MARRGVKAVSYDQASAVPFRRRGDELELCLITSSAGRWIFPKGVIDPGQSPAEAALAERQLEELGVEASDLARRVPQVEEATARLAGCDCVRTKGWRSASIGARATIPEVRFDWTICMQIVRLHFVCMSRFQKSP